MSTAIDWETVERSQLEMVRLLVEAGNTGGMPLLVSDLRLSIRRCRELGLGRDDAFRAHAPTSGSRRRGGLTAEEWRMLLDEEWPVSEAG
jgi:hypothetical protein